MFFDGHPEIYHYVSQELYALRSHLETNSYPRNRVPTHTEDGIPIRKLYVSNLPPKTTRTELFGVFAQYGFIKSCWLRMEEKGPNKSPTATYAFVTYSNPADAYKALEAPGHEKILRGRNLQISPADSWHQPVQDSEGRVRWKPRPQRPLSSADDEQGTTSTESTSEQTEAPESQNDDITEAEDTEATEAQPEEEEICTILDILNRDCLTHILSYVTMRDLIRSERVSKRWQTMVQEYMQGIRSFNTASWGGTAGGPSLTTAVLRRILARAGGALARLTVDNQWGALNDRTAHTVGKFCPNLEEIKVVGMHTKNWNPLIYGCKQLKVVSFVYCNKITDTSLVQIVKNDSCIESLSVENNTHVTGLFLTGSSPPKLTTLSFYNCYSLQGTVLSAAIDTLPHLTVLKLDCCPVSLWKVIPSILSKLPGLTELSLSEYMSPELLAQPNDDFVQSLSGLTELRELNLFKNINVTNSVLKQIAQSCTKLESLNISSCSYNRGNTTAGVNNEGMAALCRGARALRRLDVSYLEALGDAGLHELARLPRLAALVCRGNPTLTAAPFHHVLHTCHTLQELDLCGCDGVTEEVAMSAQCALELRPRPLLLRLAATAAASAQELPRHKLLAVNVADDLCNPHLRPDFVDGTFYEDSDDSIDEDDDDYDHEDIVEFFHGGNLYFPSDDELMDDDDFDDNLEGIFAYRIDGQDVILL